MSAFVRFPFGVDRLDFPWPLATRASGHDSVQRGGGREGGGPFSLVPNKISLVLPCSLFFLIFRLQCPCSLKYHADTAQPLFPCSQHYLFSFSQCFFDHFPCNPLVEPPKHVECTCKEVLHGPWTVM